MAFDAGLNVARGKSPSQAALAAARSQIPNGPAKAAFDTAVALARGQKLQRAAYAGARGLIPASPYAADALSFVRNVAAGRNMQTAALSRAGRQVLSRMSSRPSPASSGGDNQKEYLGR
jgi:hypothetical protein